VIPLPAAERVTLPEAFPSIEALFRFAAEAELRVGSLRMVIEEHRLSARGEEVLQNEIWLRHPGQARVTTRRDQASPSRDYEVWLLQGGMVTTYAAARRVASRRPRPGHVVGYDGADLPEFARQRGMLTPLPAGSLADTFVHPHGLFRNVLVTGTLSVAGARPVQGREAIVVRAAHPRTAEVLLDRPDRVVEVGIGRETGFVLLLSERIGETVTRSAEVTELLVDPVIPSSAFELRLPADVRVLY
jgi:hypothetical protein